MFGPTFRLLLCFVAIPGVFGVLAFAYQFYITYVMHERFSMNFGAIAAATVLALIPGLLVYVLLVAVAGATAKKK